MKFGWPCQIHRQTDTAYCKKFVMKFVMMRMMIVVVVMVKATANQLAVALVGITANMFYTS